jgi:hypothetical protein
MTPGRRLSPTYFLLFDTLFDTDSCRVSQARALVRESPRFPLPMNQQVHQSAVGKRWTLSHCRLHIAACTLPLAY